MAPGGDALGTKAVRFVTRWLASFVLLLAGTAASAPTNSGPRRLSAVRVEWRAALDQLRTEINTQPAVASAFTFSGQRRLPASDPRTMPALVQLNAVTSQIFTGIGRSPVPVLLPFDTAAFLDARLNGAPPSLSLARYQADFRPVDLFDAGPAGYDAMFLARARRRRRHAAADLRQTGRSADHRLDPDLRHQRSPRRQGRAGQVAGGAISRPAPLHPRRLCALCLHALRRSLCGVDPVPRLDAARAAAGLPRGLPGRRAFPEGAARRRRPAVAAAHRTSPPSIAERPAERCRPISPTARAATSSPTPAFASRAAMPTSPPIRKSAFRWRRPRPSSTRNPSGTPAATRRAAGRRQCRLSLAGQFLRGPQLQRRTMRRRFRPSGPGYPRRRTCAARGEAAIAAIPSSRRSSPCATAS